LETLSALVLAVALSIALLVYHAAGARVRRMGRLPSGTFGDVRAHPEAGINPAILVLRPNAELFFANAETVAEEINQAAVEGDPRPRAVVLDLESTDDVDVPACDALCRLAEQLAAEGIRLTLARVHPDALRILERTGVVFSRVEDAVVAFEGTVR